MRRTCCGLCSRAWTHERRPPADRARVVARSRQAIVGPLYKAEQELETATTRTAINAAAKKLTRVKAELKRLQAEVSASSGV
jgi:hypothetical protein